MLQALHHRDYVRNFTYTIIDCVPTYVQECQVTVSEVTTPLITVVAMFHKALEKIPWNSNNSIKATKLAFVIPVVVDDAMCAKNQDLKRENMLMIQLQKQQIATSTSCTMSARYNESNRDNTLKRASQGGHLPARNAQANEHRHEIHDPTAPSIIQEEELSMWPEINRELN